MTVGAQLHARWRVRVAVAVAVAVSVSVFGLASGGCERLRPGACSTGLIEQATTALGAAAPGPRASEAAVERLERSCPSLPDALSRSLRRDYAGATVSDQRSAPIVRADEFIEERDRMCADATAWEASEDDLRWPARSAVIYERCQLGRLELLDAGAGETFSLADLTGFVTYHWLTRRGVKDEVARGFTRALMHETASSPVLRQRCDRDPSTPACAVLLRRVGVTPPRSSASYPARAGPRVIVSAGALRHGALELALEAGALPAGSLEHHVIPALRPYLEARATRDKGSTEESTAEWSDALLVSLDREVPLETLLRVMYTGARAGYRRFNITVTNDARLGPQQLPVLPPYAWIADPSRRREARTRPVVTLGPDAITFDFHGDVTTLARDDDDGLRARAAEYVKRLPHASLVAVRAPPSTSVARVVTLLDALRGEACAQPGLHEDSGCLLWEVILGASPPYGRREGDWRALSLSLVELEPEPEDRPRARRERARVAALRARVEARLPALETCLKSHEQASVDMPRGFEVTFVRRGGELKARLYSAESRALPYDCMLTAIGVPGFEPHELTHDYVAVGVRVALPVQPSG